MHLLRLHTIKTKESTEYARDKCDLTQGEVVG